MGGSRFCPIRRCGEVPVRAVRQRTDASLPGQFVGQQCQAPRGAVHRVCEDV